MKDHPLVYAKYPNFVNSFAEEIKLENYEGPQFELCAWQKEVKELLSGPIVHRRIIWIWSDKSKTGKTLFMQHIASIYKNKYLITDDLDKKNVLYAYNGHHIIHIALPRDVSIAQLNFLKGTIELLSDGGLHMSSKYEARNKLVSAHIVVTSNQPPDVKSLPHRFLEYRVNQQGEHLKTDHQYNFDWKALINQPPRIQEEDELSEFSIYFNNNP